jgi:hypothetical protein
VPANPWCSGEVAAVKGCVARKGTRVAFAVALRERFVSVSVKVGKGKAVSHKAHGRKTRLTIDLGSGPGRRLRVKFVEHIKVGRHKETVSFTRIYRRC